MLTQDACDLTGLLQFLAEYPLLYYGLTFERDKGVEGHPAVVGQRFRQVAAALEYSARKLRHWQEEAAARGLEELLEECRVLEDPGSLDDARVRPVVQDLIRRALVVNNRLQRLSPMAMHLAEEVPWGAGEPSESDWAFSDKATVASTRRRRGYLVCLWFCRGDAVDSSDILRLIRGELNLSGALRLRPYKATTQQEDPDAQKEPTWGRVPVPVIALRPRDRELRERQIIDPSLFLKPGAGNTILHENTRWIPEETTGHLATESIGYFFLPAPSSCDAHGLDGREFLALLIRLAWGLSAFIPGQDGKDRLGFRLFAMQTELEWQRGGPTGHEGRPGHTPPRILDRWSFLELVARLFQDESTRNCTVVESRLLEDGAPHADWFRPTWYIPVDHRRRWGEPPSPWLMSAPRFDGRPSWTERIDLSRPSVRRPRVWGGDFPKDEFPRHVDHRQLFRRSARILPPRPLRCAFLLEESEDAAWVERRAFLLDFSAGGCCVFLPSETDELVDTVLRVLREPGDFSHAAVRIGAGLVLPWGSLRSGRGGTVQTALPRPPRGEETRVHVTRNRALRQSGVRVRFMVGSVVESSDGR